MRPPISWSQLTSAAVGLWGIGVEGTASLHRLRAMGVVPLLVDDAPGAAGAASAEGLEILATTQGGLDALLRCDVVIKSPGISRYRPEVAQLEQAGIPVRGGLGLWLEDTDRSKVACITGTKGKSTTTALAGHFLARLGHRARVGGNLGQPPWEPSAEPEPDVWVIETSSYQVPDLTTGPAVAAVT
jgi:UDP-N-acetylmuramoylalanine-D-glutamate ligase